MASRYNPDTKTSRKKRPIGTFLAIFIILIFTIIYNLPQITVNQKIGNWKIDKIGGYSLNLFGQNKDLSLRRGLDLQGGVQLTLQADMKGIEERDRQKALDSAREVIDRRVNLYGVSEPVIQSAKSGNDYRIIVELPGVTNVNEALDLIGRTARLEFREPMNASESAEERKKILSEVTKSATDAAEASFSAQLEQYLASQTFYKPTELTGKDLKRAEVGFDQRTGEPLVSLEFNQRGTQLFADLTKKYLGQTIAMYLDDQQITTPPEVRTPILDGKAQITGNFTVASAQQLATQLNAGALPVPIQIIEQRTIGATLGAQSVNKSLIAGVVGLSIVALFMIALYGFRGVLAVCALILYTLISLFIFRFIPVTLTLAGIAGFILSIGMALDANILIFERMREEMHWGKSRPEALRLGFDRAWSSIRDSNVSSLITCFILYSFGTGLIRGFALTLAIGIIVSMFTAITVTRTLLRMFYK